MTETESTIIKENPELMDTLLQDIYERLQDTDYYEETTDMNGETYTGEVYLKGEYRPEGVFLFNQEGALSYYLRTEDPEADKPSANDAVYTIYAIDEDVDPSLFDFSDYMLE